MSRVFRHWRREMKLYNPFTLRDLRRRTSIALAGVALLLPAGFLRAQTPEAPRAGEAAPEAPGEKPSLTVADVEDRLAAVEADAGIDDAVKETLRAKYKQAIGALKKAGEDAARAAEYRDSIASAPAETAALRTRLNALPAVEDAAAVSPPAAEDLQQEILSRRATLAELKGQLTDLADALTQMSARPTEISARLPEARRELADVERQLAPLVQARDESPGREAERIVLEAQRMVLARELEMLDREQRSQAVRKDELIARRDLMTRQVENDGAALEALANRQLMTDARRVANLADTTRAGAAGGNEAVQALAAEVQALSDEFQEVAQKLKDAGGEHDEVTAKLDTLSRNYERTVRQLSLSTNEAAFSHVLLLQRRHLPDPRSLSRVLEARQEELNAVRLAAFQIEDKLEEQVSVEKAFAGDPSEAAAQLVAARGEVLDKLNTQYRTLAQNLALLDSDERHYLDKVKEVRAFLREKLFWVRSSPAAGPETLKKLPESLFWLFGSGRWAEFASALKGVFVEMPVRSVVVFLVAAALLVFRRRTVAALETTGQEVRRISTDRYALTGKALLCTFLMTAPLPLLLGFSGWALGRAPEASDWLRGLTFGLKNAAWMAYAFLFVRVVARRGGLGAAHFGWPEQALCQLRQAVGWLMAIILPAVLIIGTTGFEDAKGQLDSVGRLSLIVANLCSGVVMWRLFRPSNGVFSSMVREAAGGHSARWEHLMCWSMVAIAIGLTVLAYIGYTITALILGVMVLAALRLLVGAAILYGLVLRWFTSKWRKLALAEAMEQRRTRREAAKAAAAAGEESSEEIVPVDVTDAELDLASIGSQTRRLLRFLVGLAATLTIWFLWSEMIPSLGALDTVTVLWGLSLLGIVQAILIVGVTLVISKNLPGLLEVAVLRATTIDVGTRNAIATLCQYAVIAIGLGLLFDALSLDWSKFGWMAAALSVGLGFGLQEVVANFVCGIILLFERPIRVGDIVTLEDVTGTVTKIRMRATTITNWDRKEFVVPNKQFITGTLMNWTLSSSINRVVITVGVAYGSDTEKARQIMLEIAHDHPLVLDDPAPMATFEAFADSSLNLLLRAYLPDLDNRMKTISDLHTEIDKRFKKAGIEIAFPQRDLHLRSGWESIRPAGSGGGSAEKGAS